MGSLSVGQVVLAKFPFSDLSSLKLRPCLIIGLAEFEDVILCQITSKPYGSRRAIPLTAQDFRIGSLAIDSFIRPDKIATLDPKMIKETVGSLNKKKLVEFKRDLKRVLELN